MKIYYFLIIIFLYSFIGCNIKNTNKIMSEYNAQKPENVSKHAQKLNIGFEDRPVYVWAEITGNLKIGERVFDHILGIKFTYETGEVFVHYYETEGRRKINIECEGHEYSVVLYPGDLTVKLSYKNKKKILFNVLEIEDDDPEWLRIPTTKKNHNNELVSGYATRIEIIELDDKKYLVKFNDDKGRREYKYKANKQISNIREISYLDRTDGNIYFLNRDEFLSLIDISDAKNI